MIRRHLGAVAVLGMIGVAVLLALAIPNPCRAADITWTFGGTLLRIDGTPLSPVLQSLGVQIGAPVQGMIRFQSDTPASSGSNANVGQYYGAVEASSLTMGGWSLAQGSFASDPNQTARDLLVSYYPSVPTFLEQSQIDMFDPTGTYPFSVLLGLELTTRQPGVFTSTALPLNPPDLSLLDPFNPSPSPGSGFGTDVVLDAEGGNGSYNGIYNSFRVSLTSLVRVVPEPGAGGLAALGALVSVLLARRR